MIGERELFERASRLWLGLLEGVANGEAADAEDLDDLTRCLLLGLESGVAR